MKYSALSSLSVLSLMIGTLTLVGCGAGSSFSNPVPPASSAPPTTAQVVPGPAIQGSVYGGHAPIQGAHIYLLQPGITGPGSLATSLLGSGTTNSPGGFTLSTNTSAVADPNVPIGAQFVTSDANGIFNLSGAYTCTVGQPVYIYGYGGKIGTTALNNNNIVQLLTLGNCPGGSGEFAGSVSFVYLNEVSTVATAYTFQPFTLPTNNDAWHIGTNNTTQGLLGIANAALTAAQLYNIQGGTQLSTSHDGEGHIANYQTLLNGVSDRGNGIVPQSTIDTLANVLADCVDSTVVAVGTPTGECAKLFAVATNNGETTTTTPTVDTGTAMLNIARFPAGNHSAGSANVSSTYVSTIFALQGGGTTPYIPQLSVAPNDWTLAINYPVTAVTGYPQATNNTLGNAESVAIDNAGQIWVTAQAGDYINRFSNLGASNSLDTLTYIPGYVSIDGSNNAWTGNANSTSPIYEAGSNGQFTTQYGQDYNSAYTVITNQAGDAFFFAKDGDPAPLNTGSNYAMFEYDPNGNLVAGSPFNISSPTTTTAAGTGTLTITNASEATTCSGVEIFGVCVGGTFTYTYTFTATNPGTPTGAAALAAGQTVNLTLTNNANGNRWPRLNGNQTVATANGTRFTVTSGTDQGITGNGTGTGTYTTTVTTTTPNALVPGTNVAHGAIDSTGDLWITSEGGGTIARITPTGTLVFPTITGLLSQPEFPAIDASNNAWIPGYETNSVYFVSSTGTLSTFNSANTGAAIVYPFGSAVDGNGNIWITNRCGPMNICGNVANTSTLVELNGGVVTPGTAHMAISPGTNYVPEIQYTGATTPSKILPDPLNLAIDSSGNIWITNYVGGSGASSALVEVIGAAAPVTTPLSLAAGNNALGVKP
jgi:streptogramin lyase